MFLVFLLLLVGCGARPQPTTAPSIATSSLAETTPLPRPTLPEIPTLLPTFTPLTQATATVTRPPQPTPIPSATVNLTAVAIILEYNIPALGLTRTLTATFASQLTLHDAATGKTVNQNQQARVLLELQTALDGLVLEPLPEGCDLCPRLRYTLPLSEQGGDGWLTDPVLLASLENYFAVHLGPHWPPDTVLALRRSASVYRSAHTVAITSEGQMWRWTAIDNQIAPPIPSPLDSETVLAALEIELLANRYEQECIGMARETLYLVTADGAKTIAVRCPELTLPASLAPLYTALANPLTGFNLGEGEEDRAPLFPYTTALYYQRADGYRLVLDASGELIIAVEGEIEATGTITASLVISLTTMAFESGEMAPGTPALVGTLTATSQDEVPAYFLMVRGPEGTMEAVWDEAAAASLSELVALLDQLIDERVGLLPEPPDEEAEE